VISVSRLLRAVLIAGACALFFATHVYVQFTGTRAKVVRTPIVAADGIVRATAAPAVLKDLPAPFAVIARIRNESPAADRFVIQIDGVTVCDPSVAAKSTHRVDCVLNHEWSSRIPHDVTVRSAAGAWALEYLELSTHHGQSFWGVALVVLPAISHQFVRPAIGWIACVWLALTGLLLLPAPSLPRWLAALYAAVAAFFVLWIVTFALAPWVSPYTVVVDAHSFANWLVVLLAPRLYLAGRAPVRVLVTSRAPWIRAARPFIVGLLVFACFGAAVHRRLRESYDGNYSGFLHIAPATFERNPLLNTRDDVRRTLRFEEGGYDGQFMYFSAFDPLLRAFHDRPELYALYMDNAPYRFGRIGYGWLTKVVSFNQWQRYPVTMIWLVLGALFLSALVLSFIARNAGAGAAWGLLVLLVPGFWESIQTSLPEPIAAALILAGCWCLMKGRWVVAAALFAGSVLTRETGVVLVVCVGVGAMLAGRRKAAFAGLAGALLPFMAWRVYLGWVLFPSFGPAAFLPIARLSTWPFAGFVQLWSAVRQGTYPAVLTTSAITFPILLTAAFVLALWIAIRKPSALSVATVFYGWLAISLDYQNVWVHVGNGMRTSYEVFVLLALASPSAVRLSRGLRMGVLLFWAAAAWYIAFGYFESTFVRESLFPAIW
jgi:hypothetical protein